MHGVRYCESREAQQYHSSKLISICYVVRTSVLCTFQIKYRLISFCINDLIQAIWTVHIINPEF